MSVDEVLKKIEDLKGKYENDEELVKLLTQYENSLKESKPPLTLDVFSHRCL